MVFVIVGKNFRQLAVFKFIWKYVNLPKSVIIFTDIGNSIYQYLERQNEYSLDATIMQAFAQPP